MSSNSSTTTTTTPTTTTPSAAHPASTPPDVPSTQPSAPTAGANHVAAPHAGPGGAAAQHTHAAVDADGGGTERETHDGKNPAARGLDGGLPSALPAPGAGEGEAGNNTTTTTLEMDGKAVALDHLGPMVVGRDGTISRIANWGEMAEIERQNTLRILTKRNKVRLAALRGADKTEAS